MKMKEIFLVSLLVGSFAAQADSCQQLAQVESDLQACTLTNSDKDNQIGALQTTISGLQDDLYVDVQSLVRRCRQDNREKRDEINYLAEVNQDIRAEIRDNRDTLREKRQEVRQATAYWECTLVDRKNSHVAVGSGSDQETAWRNARYESHAKDQFRKHGYLKPTASQLFQRRNPNARPGKKRGKFLKVHQRADKRDYGFCFRVFKNQNVAQMASPADVYRPMQ